MRCVTKASIAYIMTQVMSSMFFSDIVILIHCTQTCFALTSTQVFSCTNHVTDSKHFYNSVLELLDDPEEKEEVDQLTVWWNRLVSL